MRELKNRHWIWHNEADIFFVDLLLKHYNLDGKTIHPFCTNEGSGMGGSVRWIREAAPGANVSGGLPIHGAEAAQSESKVAQWAKSLI